ncbi:MAG: hypothetical protein JWP97_4408, partial [Labilithrix sp.]|nr:hypothetical protein [Labilithrix sp.]
MAGPLTSPMSMNKRSAAVVLVLTMLALVTGCSRSEHDAAPPAAAAPSPAPSVG